MGIGQKLWTGRRDLLRSSLSQKASIGMDGAVAMQPFYAKGGFNIAFRNERYVHIGEVFPTHPRVRPMRDSDYPGVLLYDQGCFRFERKGFLIPWLQIPDKVETMINTSAFFSICLLTSSRSLRMKVAPNQFSFRC